MSRPANLIRKDFIDFFVSRKHTFVPSSPVVPQDDPTLLFTNAGMNQFKPIFLGDNRGGLTRAVNSQKCMRVSGKHNDLEEVGRDHYHHTFFEMLGNWSFGDYYKKDAIAWAWELLTGVWKLPQDRLFVTVHESDGEAAELWRTLTDIDPDRIMRFGDKSNFWEMGATGPCGPCSEIHYDLGDKGDRDRVFRDPVNGVNGENARFREIWNLVFIQYDREKDGTLVDLPNKHVDTGMGLERLVSLLQGTSSNYDTDLFMPIIRETERLSCRSYAKDEAGTPFRVIADHIRALTFAITDGAFPSNEGRGYVVRRLLRRAFRFGRELGFSGPFLYKLVPSVLAVLGEAYPEIGQRRQYVEEVIRSEEERFGTTLDQGIERFGEMVATRRTAGSTVLTGADVFTLYDTYGFPMDLTRLMAREQGFSVDEDGYERLMDVQRERAREAARREEQALSAGGWIELSPTQGTEFVGYHQQEAEVNVTRYRVASERPGEIEYLVITDRTPFYAESGGQVGDQGTFTTASGAKAAVEDTFKQHETVMHRVRSSQPIAAADWASPVIASVADDERAATKRNHSATHLLQAALRKVLGEHVQQSGSRVDPQRARFDFTHFRALTDEEMAAVERQVNEWVLMDLPVTCEHKSLDQAKREGATALFGEKYGETVRVVSMGDVSRELCGGTHVQSTGEIGLFHIASESSTSAGVRRIEALTGLNSLHYLLRAESAVTGLVRLLKVDESKVVAKVSSLLDEVHSLETELQRLRQNASAGAVASLFDEARHGGGPFFWLVKDLGEIDKDSFASVTDALSDAVRQPGQTAMVFVLGGHSDGKALLAACAGKEAVDRYGIHCGAIIKAAAQKAGGGGGGSPHRAQAGGKSPEKLDEALAEARRLVSEKAGAQ